MQFHDCGHDQGWFERKNILFLQFTMNRHTSLSKNYGSDCGPPLKILKNAHLSTQKWSATIDLMI
jgi:hypothetical protein